MPHQATVVVVFDRTAEVAADLMSEAATLRQETGDRIKAQSVENAAEETGSLKAGHYVVDERGSGYDAAVAAAQAKNPDVGILPEVPAEPNTTIIAVAVEHGEPAEFYTGEKNPDAHPYLTPAAEGERAAFDAGIERLGGKVR